MFHQLKTGKMAACDCFVLPITFLLLKENYNVFINVFSPCSDAVPTKGRTLQALWVGQSSMWG